MQGLHFFKFVCLSINRNQLFFIAFCCSHVLASMFVESLASLIQTVSKFYLLSYTYWKLDNFNILILSKVHFGLFKMHRLDGATLFVVVAKLRVVGS